MTTTATFVPGADDLAARSARLADRLTPGLKPLAAVAYNYAWSWMHDGTEVVVSDAPGKAQARATAALVADAVGVGITSNTSA